MEIPRPVENRGCLGDGQAGRGTAPDYGFTAAQRQSLARFLQTDRQSLRRSVPVEFSRRQFEILRCAVCHRRDGIESRLPYILEEESNLGLPPETMPDLTWSGEKLQPAWVTRFLRGELPYRPRPWLRSRMASFATRAGLLAEGLSGEHGFGLDDRRSPPDREMGKVGSTLIRKETGFHCVQCHALGTQPAEAPFETPGINFFHVYSRLRYSYFRRWISNPLRIDPATKMPLFAPDGSATVIRHIYGGDAERQFDAIWNFFGSIQER